MKRLALLTLFLLSCGKKEEHSDNDEHGHGKEEKPEKTEKGEKKEGEHGEHEEGEEEGVVHLTKEQMATVKVATQVVTTRAVSSEIQATAEIVPPDDGIARVSRCRERLGVSATAIGLGITRVRTSDWTDERCDQCN